MRFTVRSVSLAVVALLGSLSLTACSTTTDDCTNPLGAGSASQVNVSGSFGSAPTVDFPLPFVGRDASVATNSSGTGAMVTDGTYVDFEATVFRGSDKTVLTSTAYGQNGSDPQRIAVTLGSNLLADSFLCHRAGERFTLTGTAADIFGAVDGNGLQGTDTIVVVFDIMGVYPHAANGTPQIAQDGLPAVTSAPDGRPGIAVPNTAPPTELRIETLTKGDGDTVAEGDTVVAHYLGVIWGGSVFDSTWESNRPANLVAQSFVDHGGKGVVPGFAKALIGQTVGSRVVVSIPPSEGYPVGQSPTSIPADSTMIFIIDILGIK